jgi:hypothetical protein
MEQPQSLIDEGLIHDMRSKLQLLSISMHSDRESAPPVQFPIAAQAAR